MSDLNADVNEAGVASCDNAQVLAAINTDVSLASAWSELPYALGIPTLACSIKVSVQDFIVDEVLGFEPDGKGEHLLVHIEKTGLSTLDVQQKLAQHFALPYKAVSYSGMKDRQAVTTQWFGVQLPGKKELPALPEATAELRIIETRRNSRKLRIGTHQANRFKLRLTNLQGDLDDLRRRLDIIRAEGVPNYFGNQRFGRSGSNLIQVQQFFQNPALAPARNKRSLLLSAARSFLFNRLLAQRVTAQSWNKALRGDLMSLSGSSRTFAQSRAEPAELAERLSRFDIHPSGPLWGRGASAVSADSAALEAGIAAQYPLLIEGLARNALEHDRRPLRLEVCNLACEFLDDSVTLDFTLARGGFATAVLRELVLLTE